MSGIIENYGKDWSDKDEIIHEIKGKISSLQRCLADKDWASTDSDYHKQIRKSYAKKIVIWNNVLDYLTKNKLMKTY